MKAGCKENSKFEFSRRCRLLLKMDPIQLSRLILIRNRVKSDTWPLLTLTGIHALDWLLPTGISRYNRYFRFSMASLIRIPTYILKETMDCGTQMLDSELQGLWQRHRYSRMHPLHPSPHTYTQLFLGLQKCIWIISLRSFWSKDVFFLRGLYSGVFYLKLGATVAPSTPLWILTLEHHSPEGLRRKGGWGSWPMLRVSSQKSLSKMLYFFPRFLRWVLRSVGWGYGLIIAEGTSTDTDPSQRRMQEGTDTEDEELVLLNQPCISWLDLKI